MLVHELDRHGTLADGGRLGPALPDEAPHEGTKTEPFLPLSRRGESEDA
jgi:hypothetical protein